jgi:hypothetical protein
MGTLHTGFGKGLLDTGVVFFRPDLSSLGESLILVWPGFHGQVSVERSPRDFQRIAYVPYAVAFVLMKLLCHPDFGIIGGYRFSTT